MLESHKHGLISKTGRVLFLDRLHAGIEAADHVTSFFVRRYIYFAFFGKSVWLTRSPTDQAGHSSPDRPPSPIFVENDAPLPDTPAPDHHRPHEEPGEQHQLTTKAIEGRQAINSQQLSESSHEENARRRERRRFQMRRSVSLPTEEIQGEPIELEPPNVETPDHLILDRESPPEEIRNSVEPPTPLETVDPASTATRSSRAVSDVPDGRSDRTRVSLGTVPLTV